MDLAFGYKVNEENLDKYFESKVSLYDYSSEKLKHIIGKMIDPAIAIDDHLDKSISHRNVIERVITKAIISKIAPTKPIKSNFFFMLFIF